MVSSKKIDFFSGLFKTLLITGLVLYIYSTYIFNQYPVSNYFFSPLIIKKPDSIPIIRLIESSTQSPTNLSHLVFGLVGSEKAWHKRKSYIESWWQPNTTRGFLFLDKPPSAKLLPWSPTSPPYRISDDLTVFLNKTDNITAQRILNGIMETFREGHENMRWLVMGDDDSIFFLENIIDVLSQYDHTKYYYIGGHSEFVLANYRHSFSQGFGGAGFILSYPLAKVLAEDMKNCLLRYTHLDAADQTTMSCIADLGVSLTSHKGIHQIDLRGDLWGFLSAHPSSPLLSLHHFDMVTPIFPSMNRYESTSHLMKAAKTDQSRMLQQTICHHREKNWSFSISWGYSTHIYEKIMPRSYLQMPIQTFKPWLRNNRGPPLYMFNTRFPSKDPCEVPHIFFYEKIENTDAKQILTVFSRAWPRGFPACSLSGNNSADFVSRVQVYSPAKKRLGMDRSECCEVVRVDGENAEVKFRECVKDEIIA